MRGESLPAERVRGLDPTALVAWLERHGYIFYPCSRPDTLAIYARPAAPTAQVLVPVDRGLSDFGEAMAEAILSVSSNENRPAAQVLDELLLPDRYVIGFALADPAPPAALPLAYVIGVHEGFRRALKAVADMERLPAGLIEALEVVSPRRPHEFAAFAWPDAGRESSLLAEAFAARLKSLDSPSAEDDFRDAVRSWQPPAETALLVTVECCGGPIPHAIPEEFRLTRTDFIGYGTGPTAHTPRHRPAWFVGHVRELRGDPGPEDRPRGKVGIAVAREDRILAALLDLDADNYATAAAAHLANNPVYFRASLVRDGAAWRVTDLEHFLVIQRPAIGQAG